MLATAIANAEWFDATIVANELDWMSNAQLDNLEERYDEQIANLLGMSSSQKMAVLVDG